MLKRYAIGFGVVILLIGIAGYIPALTPRGNLFGLFAVDPMHNIVHLITGAAGIVVGYSSEHASRVFFETVGIVYAILVVAGLAYGGGPMMNMAHNWSDVVLHLVIALFSLYMGYMYTRKPHHPAHA
jgi:hypothetical protein